MEELFGTAISRRLLVGVMGDDVLELGQDEPAQDDELRLWAERILDAKRAEENVRPEPCRLAAARAMREEREAMEKEDWSRAWRANVRARVNLELARLSAERRGMMEALKRESESLLDSESADAETRLAVFLLSQRMGLVRPTLKMVNNLKGGSSDEQRRALDAVGRAGTYDDSSSGRKWRSAPWARLKPDIEVMKKLPAREGVAACDCSERGGGLSRQ